MARKIIPNQHRETRNIGKGETPCQDHKGEAKEGSLQRNGCKMSWVVWSGVGVGLAGLIFERL